MMQSLWGTECRYDKWSGKYCWLQNLNTQIGSYEATNGSTTIFDYRNADPLKST